MYDVELHPLLWLAELAIGLAMLVVLLLCAAVCTVLVGRIDVSQALRYIAVSSCFVLLAAISMHVFDTRTHLIGSMIAGVSIAFTAPLHASAYLHSAHKAPPSPKPTHVRAAILRIALPAAVPSPRHPPVSFRTHLTRSAAFLVVATVAAPWLDAVLSLRSSWAVDAYAMLILFSGANIALCATSAVLACCGVPAAAVFRAPFASTSMAQFWAGRWNAPVSDALRLGVYQPLLACGASRSFAVLACFVVSGLAHEVVLLFSNVRTSRAEWLTFFVAAGVATAVESNLYRRRFPSSAVVRWVLTQGVLTLLFHWRFVPVILRTDLARDGVKALSTGSTLVLVLVRRAGLSL